MWAKLKPQNIFIVFLPKLCHFLNDDDDDVGGELIFLIQGPCEQEVAVDFIAKWNGMSHKENSGRG